MSDTAVPPDAPDPGTVDDVFLVYETRIEEGAVRYYGTPVVPIRDVAQTIWPRFREAGYEVTIQRDLGEWVIEARPITLGVNGIPWTNIILALATIGSTLYAGAAWYHLDPTSLEILHAWPFALGIMLVLGIHELGHYVLSRHHRVKASLPYFIPVPTLIGTMGAVIKMEGHIPSRKALFDIGVAGPLAGLIATVGVTVVGLHLPPVEAPQEVMTSPDAIEIELGWPPLLEFLAWATGQPLTYQDPALAVNPVVIAGWVGMFVTLLNMIPVGQLDGGHIVRAILGRRQAQIASLVPVSLFGLAAYLYFVVEVSAQGAAIWVVWGVLTAIFMLVGPAQPIDDEPLDTKRVIVGIFTFALALLCFTPVPLQLHT